MDKKKSVTTAMENLDMDFIFFSKKNINIVFLKYKIIFIYKN